MANDPAGLMGCISAPRRRRLRPELVALAVLALAGCGAAPDAVPKAQAARAPELRAWQAVTRSLLGTLGATIGLVGAVLLVRALALAERKAAVKAASEGSTACDGYDENGNRIWFRACGKCGVRFAAHGELPLRLCEGCRPGAQDAPGGPRGGGMVSDSLESPDAASGPPGGAL